MKLRIALLLCFALDVIPASAQVLYSNGPINGTVDAWAPNFGYVVSDSFSLTSAATVGGFSFGVWESPGVTLLSVDWSITSAEFGGTVYGSGTARRYENLTDQFISVNQYGYDIDEITVSGLNVGLSANTYWLNLQNCTPEIYWDENSGAGCTSQGCPSLASDSAVGTIPSESFTIYGTTSTGVTPEPSSIMLFGSGIVGLAGVLRRKRLVTPG
jgi:hypothetical protein